MGVPYIEAPCEAEAQCAQLVKEGKVYATGTEDMDALTFGSTILLRHLTFSEARKMPIKEFKLEKCLEELNLTQNQFIDLCILLGCDYCDSIRGIGPKRAIELIREHKTIESILESIDTKKYVVPDNWLFKEARRLFLAPEVLKGDEIQPLKWIEPDEEALVEFLVKEKGFAEDRVRNGCKKLCKARTTTTQGRLDGFFKVIPSSAASSTNSSNGKKRKTDLKKTKDGKVKKNKVGGGGFRRPK